VSKRSPDESNWLEVVAFWELGFIGPLYGCRRLPWRVAVAGESLVPSLELDVDVTPIVSTSVFEGAMEGSTAAQSVLEQFGKNLLAEWRHHGSIERFEVDLTAGLVALDRPALQYKEEPVQKANASEGLQIGFVALSVSYRSLYGQTAFDEIETALLPKWMKQALVDIAARSKRGIEATPSRQLSLSDEATRLVESMISGQTIPISGA
jgi:hypothetical protein